MEHNTRILAVALGLLVLVALGLAVSARGEPSPDSSGPPDTTTSAAPDDPPDTTASTTTTTTMAPTTTTIDPQQARLDEIVAAMDRAELAAQLVVSGITGRETASRLVDTVGTACIAGVFVTESNDNWAPVDSPTAAAAMIDDIRLTAANTGCASPPLVMTDAELGEIVRVPVMSPGSARDYSDRFSDARDDTIADLRDDGSTFAAALQSLGIDVNFGSVADVDTAPDHFMARSGRTYGADPGTVAALANGFVQSHCDVGLAATLKHFPNQGATREDPHRERSVAIGGVDVWRETGLLPYVDTPAPLVMTGHIFMDIDNDRPASMSRAITTGLLREELGYDGVVITDDLSTMRGAIDVIGDAGGRAVAAIQAGADLVLFVRDADVAVVLASLESEMLTDASFEAQVREHVARVMRLKGALGRLAEIDAAAVPLCG